MFDLDIDAPKNARALVIIIHGHEVDKDWGFLPWLGEYLCAGGFAVVRFTLESPGDVIEVAKIAQARFRGLPLFLLGHSLGGAIALVMAREIEDLAGVITLSAISRDEVVEAAKHLGVPLLAIHGSNDATVPAGDSKGLVAATRDGSFVLIDGASHTYNAIHPLVYVPRALEYAALVTAQFISVHS